MNHKSISTVLMVEDNQGDTRLLREMFYEQGSHDTVMAHVEYLSEAEKYLAENRVDIILLDLRLPDAQGLEVVRRTRKAAPLVPMVVLTGLDDESMALQTLQEGAQDYLIKGQIESPGLLRALRYAIERKRGEVKLQDSEQLLKLIIDTLPQAIWWKDSELNYIGCNRALAGAAGFESPDQIIGMSDYDMSWTNEESAFYRECDRRVMRTGIPELDIVESQLQSDGKQAWINTNKAPLRNGGGEVVGVLGTFVDITAQRNANSALRESEYKFRTLMESMREGLLQVAPSDRIIFVNDSFCEMVGYTRDELIGKDWARLLLDEEGHNFIEQVRKRRNEGISDNYEICLRKKSGDMLWVIVGGAPILDAQGAISGSMGIFTDITERKNIEEQLLYDAFHDGLTGLANRTLFMEHLHLTIERSKRRPDATFALLFLDLDRFKIINDSLGHSAGDKLLKLIGERLEKTLRPGDLIARLGGDEFTILLNELDDKSDAFRIAERIQEDLKAPFDLSDRKVFTSASIGIALSSSGHSQAEDMLRDADVAMYRAKAKGKAQYQIFDRTMHQNALQQLKFETEMRYALERGEFSLHYQPIIELKTNDLKGFEALVRWNHPTRGMVSPMEFIPTAEENGLILPLGKWILQESCRQLRKWQNHNSLAATIAISVNLSSKQFLQPDLSQQVAAVLEETGLSPSCLKLEITESHFLDNTEMAIVTMNRLRELGIEISLDDFGTGYSSLSYLHRLPIDYLKIDRSFVSRMEEKKENAEIVHTIIKLAQNLKMKVIAEGIETAEQLNLLKKLNCEYGQGYFFSKPLKAAAVALVNSAKADFQPLINSAQ
jgi:diguanylate cyclase (GGDEF)-like protein/PAS domain S-box-containing protein